MLFCYVMFYFCMQYSSSESETETESETERPKVSKISRKHSEVLSALDTVFIITQFKGFLRSLSTLSGEATPPFLFCIPSQ